PETKLPEPEPKHEIDYNLLNSILSANIHLSNIENLLSGNDIYNEINNSKLPNEIIERLQEERKNSLFENLELKINESSNIQDLVSNKLFDNLIIKSDLNNLLKNNLHKLRQKRLQELQNSLFNYYKNIIQQTD